MLRTCIFIEYRQNLYEYKCVHMICMAGCYEMVNIPLDSSCDLILIFNGGQLYKIKAQKGWVNRYYYFSVM